MILTAGRLGLSEAMPQGAMVALWRRGSATATQTWSAVFQIRAYLRLKTSVPGTSALVTNMRTPLIS